MPSATFLIAVQNGLAFLKKECSRRDCSSVATETFMGEVYCKVHLIILERMEE